MSDTYTVCTTDEIEALGKAYRDQVGVSDMWRYKCEKAQEALAVSRAEVEKLRALVRDIVDAAPAIERMCVDALLEAAEYASENDEPETLLDRDIAAKRASLAKFLGAIEKAKGI